MSIKGYVGTYTTGLSEGIYSFIIDNNKISDVSLFSSVKNPKYLSFIGDNICAVCDFEDGSGVSIFDKKGKELSSISFESSTSCYVCCRDNYIFTANYHGGTFSILKFENNKLELVKSILIKEKAGCHQVIFYKDKYLVPCLFLDKIVVFDSSYNIEGYIEFENGSGPRHGVISNDLRYMYVVGELSNKLYVIDMETLTVINSINLLKDKEFVKDSAAIRISDDNKYIYVSTRTEDVISVLLVDDDKVNLKQIESCNGLHPRDFINTKDSLIILNRLSNNISLISLKDGVIDKVEDSTYLPEGISVILEGK